MIFYPMDPTVCVPFIALSREVVKWNAIFFYWFFFSKNKWLAATNSSNAFVKRALRKKQEELSDEELEELMTALEGLEQLVKNLEAAFGI